MSSGQRSPNSTPSKRVESDVVHLGDMDDGSSPRAAAAAAPRAGADIESQSSLSAQKGGGTSPSKRRNLAFILLGILLLLLAVVIPVAVTQSGNNSDRSGGSVEIGDDVGDGGTEMPSKAPVSEAPVSEAPTLPRAPTVAPTSSAPSISASPSLSQEPTGTPTLHPTTAFPTLKPVTSSPTLGGGQLLNLFSQVTPIDVLRDSSTPQHQAWQYLSSPGNRGGASEDPELLQRYALTTMTYSLQPGQFGTLRTSDEVHECLWYGISCNNETQAIEKVVWADRGLTGTIPPEVSVLEQLQLLDLAENQVEGSLPEEIFDLTEMQELFVHQNQMTGTLSERFSRLENLVSFYGGNNNFNGTLPDGLGSGRGNSRPLRRLSLYKNSISGEIPDGLNLPFLEYLDLGHNSMSGPIYSKFRQWRGPLKHLYLDHNAFTGKVFSGANINGGRMQTYHINDNQLTGDVPGGYEILGIMQSIEIQNNMLDSFDRDMCNLIVFEGGETTNFRTDCDICTCRTMCAEQCGRAFGRNP